MPAPISKCADATALTSEAVHCVSPKMLHHGWLPASFCADCVYFRKPDFFNATEKLLVNQRPYRPAPKACGGCGTLKQRQDVLQFVYAYWHAGASGDEIRWSIRSIHKFFDGQSKVTIVGDRPPWFRGHVIDQPQIPRCKHHGFRDMLTKMWTMATHAEIDRRAVWMMDDIYFVKQVDADDLALPRAQPCYEMKNPTGWQARKQQTFDALRQERKTTHDYATHLPHVFEKDKLRHVFEKYKLHERTLLWEILYGNEFRGIPYSVSPFFRRIQQPYTVEELRQETAEASVVNHLAQLWTPSMRAFFEELLPEPAPSEIADIGWQQEFKRRKATVRTVRHVKRRPRHTHRAVIEAQQQ